MKRNFFKNEKGISLIALIVTILVMLILAVVAINAVLGDNGVIGQAEVAKEKTKVAKIKELCQLAMANSRDEFIANYYKQFVSGTTIEESFNDEQLREQMEKVTNSTLNLVMAEQYLRENFVALKYDDVEISLKSTYEGIEVIDNFVNEPKYNPIMKSYQDLYNYLKRYTDWNKIVQSGTFYKKGIEEVKTVYLDIMGDYAINKDEDLYYKYIAKTQSGPEMTVFVVEDIFSIGFFPIILNNYQLTVKYKDITYIINPWVEMQEYKKDEIGAGDEWEWAAVNIGENLVGTIQVNSYLGVDKEVIVPKYINTTTKIVSVFGSGDLPVFFESGLVIGVENEMGWKEDGNGNKILVPFEDTLESMNHYKPLIAGAGLITSAERDDINFGFDEIIEKLDLVKIGNKYCIAVTMGSTGGPIPTTSDKLVTSLKLPETLKVISNSALTMSALSSITIPKSVKIIDDNAFAKSPALTNVTFEQGSVLEEIGEETFAQTNINNFKIVSSVKKIGQRAFDNCKNLKNVIFEEGSALNEIGYSAFYGSAIENLKIVAPIERIYNYAFQECKNLTNVYIDTKGTTCGIDDYVFADTNIRKLYLGEGINRIEIWNFDNCKYLEEVWVPESLIKNSETFDSRFEDLQKDDPTTPEDEKVTVTLYISTPDGWGTTEKEAAMAKIANGSIYDAANHEMKVDNVKIIWKGETGYKEYSE